MVRSGGSTASTDIQNLADTRSVDYRLTKTYLSIPALMGPFGPV